MTALALVIALGVHLSPASAEALLYSRHAILEGELWRLWSGHFVHFSHEHLAWDLVAFAPVLWAEILAPRRTRSLLLLAPLLISVALLVGEPDLARYAGLSGVATAGLVWLALLQLTRRPAERFFWGALLVLIAAKIVGELAIPEGVFVRFNRSGPVAVPLAHVAGAVIAIVLHLAVPKRRRLAVSG